MDLSPERFGKYLLWKALGAGGAGEVFLASVAADGPTGTPIVIKRLHEHLHVSGIQRRRFLHEAKIARSIQCPNVVRVLDSGEIDERMFMAMEFVPGWPLSHILQDLFLRRSLPSVGSVVDVVSSGLEGLEAIHRAQDPVVGPLNIVHRDIAPKNIMVGRDGVVRLIDLGIGSSELQDWQTQAGITIGTRSYMSPEQARGLPIDQRSDIYAFGIVLFEFLTLTRYSTPVDGDLGVPGAVTPVFVSPSVLRDEVPEALSEVVRTALEVDPNRRFASASEFRAALREANAKTFVADSIPTVVAELIARETEQTRAGVAEDDRTEIRTLADATRVMQTKVLQESGPGSSPGIAGTFVESRSGASVLSTAAVTIPARSRSRRFPVGRVMLGVSVAVTVLAAGLLAFHVDGARDAVAPVAPATSVRAAASVTNVSPATEGEAAHNEPSAKGSSSAQEAVSAGAVSRTRPAVGAGSGTGVVGAAASRTRSGVGGRADESASAPANRTRQVAATSPVSFNDVIARAKNLRQKQRTSGADTAKVDRLLAEIMLEAGKAESSEGRSRVEAWANELTRLEN